MSPLSIITISFLIILLFLLLALIFIFNVSVGSRYRETLAKQIQSLRLHKMLHALGIDTYKYILKENTELIKQQIEHCSKCDNTQKCDEQLSNDSIKPDNIDYCNNKNSLQQLLTRVITH